MSSRTLYTPHGVLRAMLAFLADVPFGRATPPRSVAGNALVIEIAREGGAVVHTRATKLERFITSRGIKPAHLAKESGYSRQHLLRLRLGQMEATRKCIVAITDAARRLSHENVKAGDLFELRRTQ